jgi:hypothetical protein
MLQLWRSTAQGHARPSPSQSELSDQNIKYDSRILALGRYNHNNTASISPSNFSRKSPSDYRSLLKYHPRIETLYIPKVPALETVRYSRLQRLRLSILLYSRGILATKQPTTSRLSSTSSMRSAPTHPQFQASARVQ